MQLLWDFFVVNFRYDSSFCYMFRGYENSWVRLNCKIHKQLIYHEQWWFLCMRICWFMLCPWEGITFVIIHEFLQNVITLLFKTHYISTAIVNCILTYGVSKWYSMNSSYSGWYKFWNHRIILQKKSLPIQTFSKIRDWLIFSPENILLCV